MIIVKILEYIPKKSGMIKIDDNCKIIPEIADGSVVYNREYVKRTEYFGEYLGDSRIDGYPVFKIDLRAEERDRKISEILK